jgi:toxin ParE1/3/4
VKNLSLVLSDAAIADILEQAAWYEQQSGTALARRWERAVTAAVLRVLKAPETGTLCSFRSPELIGLRRKAVIGFPRHLLFYRFREGEVFILRVVHGARDLENLL